VGATVLFRLPLNAIAVVAELAMSRRSLTLVFMMLAALLALAGWLRPPLSPDVRGYNVPLAILSTTETAPETILYESRRVEPLSAGGLILAVIAVGTVVVLVRPQRLGVVASVLLCAAIAANAEVVLNHPALIELLDFEHEERQQMVEATHSAVRDPLANASNGRVHRVPPLNGRVSASATEDQERASLTRGWGYLLYGCWLIPWAALGILLGTRGSLRRRAACLGGWGLLGIATACAACSTRLAAEYSWSRAKRLETCCDYAGARRCLESAAALAPEFARLERTWLLTGELDYHLGKTTPQECFFRVNQFRYNKRWPQAIALSRELLSGAAGDEPAVRHQAARLLAALGLNFYMQDRRLMAAEDGWRGAMEVVPSRFDCAYYLGTLHARVDRDHPDRVEAEFESMRARLADRVLRAEGRATVGDAYFKAGQMMEARWNYAESSQTCTLPKIMNFRAMKGLGGM
jgi:hypothetical protein